MKLNISMCEYFGLHLADGTKAAEFRTGRIDPYVDICQEIVLDFSGVRNANSSFMNALLTGLIEQHGQRLLNVLVFKGCNPAIRVLIEAAVELGIRKTQESVGA
ncbi:MAG TPA: hypothetical protein DCZ95_18615 [Verrucomicrobia bacterium]|nr:MAG: hypothetical protein A2X46_14975 [Lentisphaerae bacterium GWF2_57_35]HBA86102.1 hypothetical protein [Verrucomicrobiota bacterium]